MNATAPVLSIPARDYLAALRERRLPIALFVGLVVAASVAIALVLPSWYVAVSTVLPPTESNQAFGIMSSMIETSALNRLGLLSTSTPSDVYAEILKSRTLREGLVRKFDLERLYRRNGMDRTLRALDQHLRIGLTASGIIMVRAEDQDPRRAADMANYLVAELDRFNREALNTQGKRTRQFLEERLAEVEQRMHAADSVLTVYEERHKVVADQGSVQGAADIVAQRLNLQVKRAYLESYSTPGSSALRSLDAEIGAFDRELARLPVLKSEGMRLALDAEIQRRVFTLLTAQLEDARVQETRDTPTLTVLDVASPPEMRARPRRSLIVMASTATALALSAAWVGAAVRRARPS